jgi:hypothetical protein
MRLDKGLSLIKTSMENHIKLQIERAELFKGIANITKNLENISINLEQSKSEKDFKNNNFEILCELTEKQNNYSDSLKVNIESKLKKFIENVSGIKEIYERIDHLRQNLIKMKKSTEKNQFIEKLINDLTETIKYADIQLLEEIKLFKSTKEKDLLILFKKFFKIKFESTEDVFI